MPSVFLDTCLSIDADYRPSDAFLDGPGPAAIDAFMADRSQKTGMIVDTHSVQTAQIIIPLAFHENYDVFVFISVTSDDLIAFIKANIGSLSRFVLPDNMIGTFSVKYGSWEKDNAGYFNVTDIITAHNVSDLPLLCGGGVFWPDEEEALVKAIKTRVASKTKTAVFTTYDSLCAFTSPAISQGGGRVLAIFDDGAYATVSRPRNYIFVAPFYTKALFFFEYFPLHTIENDVDCSGRGTPSGASHTMGRLLAVM